MRSSRTVARGITALAVGAVVTVLHAWWLTYYADPNLQKHWADSSPSLDRVVFGSYVSSAWVRKTSPSAQARRIAREFVADYPMSRPPFMFRSSAQPNSRYWMGWDHDGAGLTYVQWHALWEGAEYDPDRNESWSVLEGGRRFPSRYRDEVFAAPRGSVAGRPRDPAVPSDWTVLGVDILAGKPLRTMRATFTRPEPPPEEDDLYNFVIFDRLTFYTPVDDTIDTRRLIRVGRRGPNLYPYGLPARPIWPNFAIVSVMWAVVAWWAMLALAFVWRFGVRRQIAASRVRRGLCPGCRYPLGEHERCPECGEPAPARPRRRLTIPLPAHPAARRAVVALIIGVLITALHALAVTQTRDIFASIDRPGGIGLWMLFDRGTVHRVPGLVVFTLLWSFAAWCVLLVSAATWRVGVRRRPLETRRT